MTRPISCGFTNLFSSKALNVRVVPYINGRLFDRKVLSWKTENAALFTAKEHPKMLCDDPSSPHTNMSEYTESYGSGALLSVMCPATDYWQGKVAGTVLFGVFSYSVESISLCRHRKRHCEAFCRRDLRGSDWFAIVRDAPFEIANVIFQRL